MEVLGSETTALRIHYVFVGGCKFRVLAETEDQAIALTLGYLNEAIIDKYEPINEGLDLGIDPTIHTTRRKSHLTEYITPGCEAVIVKGRPGEREYDEQLYATIPESIGLVTLKETALMGTRPTATEPQEHTQLALPMLNIAKY